MRLHQYRRLFLDDGFLLFGCACLCAGTGLLQKLLPVVYMVEGLQLNRHAAPLGPLGPQDLDNLIWYLKMLYSFVTLSWVTIFAVKLSFLVFFRNLIRRLTGMNKYWKVVVVTTLLASGFNICEIFILCPHFNLSSRK